MLGLGPGFRVRVKVTVFALGLRPDVELIHVGAYRRYMASSSELSSKPRPVDHTKPFFTNLFEATSTLPRPSASIGKSVTVTPKSIGRPLGSPAKPLMSSRTFQTLASKLVQPSTPAAGARDSKDTAGAESPAFSSSSATTRVCERESVSESVSVSVSVSV